MRVTNGMMLGTVMFNMQRSLSRLLQLQGQLSSGRRIEKPSDDPVGTLRDLNYRNELSKNEQYRKNVNIARNRMTNYDTVLADLTNLMTSVNETAIAMSNETNESAREGAANEVKSLFDQAMRLANGTLQGSHIFSGYKSNIDALRASANGVVYQGDQGRIDFAIESSSRMTVNLAGNDVFLRQLTVLGAEADINVGVTINTLLTDLNSGNGMDQDVASSFTITDNNLGITSTISDFSGATNINDVLTAINAQLTADGLTRVTAKIGAEGNNILLDLDDSPPLLAPDSTLLINLNQGDGVDMTVGKFILTDGAGINETFDFSGATTIQDVRVIFNLQLQAKGPPLDQVYIWPNLAGTGLRVIDANGPPPLGLEIKEFNSSSTMAADLGITGAIGSELVGGNLDPKFDLSVTDVTGTIAADLGIVGDFSTDRVGTDLDPIMTAASAATTNLSSLNNGLGFEMGEIVIWQGDESRTFDLANSGLITVQDVLDLFNGSGLNITASINSSGNGIQIVNNDNTKSLTIEDVSDKRIAKEMGIFGSSDMMGSMLVLINSLKKNDGEGIRLMVGNTSDALQGILNHRAAVGASAARLEATMFRLIDLNINFTRLLSEVEDADITVVLTDLAAAENNYQASLMASAKLIQPSLMNFLR